LTRRARRGAVAVAGAVGGALVALLAVRDDAVAAVRREHATRAAHLGLAIAAEVRSVVTRLWRSLHGLVATERAEGLAAGHAAAVCAGVLAVVADLLLGDDAVAADGLTLCDRVDEAGQVSLYVDAVVWRSAWKSAISYIPFFTRPSFVAAVASRVMVPFLAP